MLLSRVRAGVVASSVSFYVVYVSTSVMELNKQLKDIEDQLNDIFDEQRTQILLSKSKSSNGVGDPEIQHPFGSFHTSGSTLVTLCILFHLRLSMKAAQHTGIPTMIRVPITVRSRVGRRLQQNHNLKQIGRFLDGNSYHNIYIYIYIYIIYKRS